MNTTPSSDGSASAAPILEVRALTKRYDTDRGSKLVLGGLDLTVTEGRFVCIVGPSGAGKTTLLRCMAGLMAPTSGDVVLEGEVVDRPPSKLAVVFQDYSRSLLPWMSVRDNIVLPLRSQGLSRADRDARASQALEAVGLAQSRDLYPWQLSGGMQQRVAIARGLAYAPDALLMDEPFASVDAQTRADLEDLMLRVRDEFGMTIVLVTHDLDEAVYLGDEVIVLSGTPTRVRATIEVDLGRRRDQLTTKALPEFAELRSQVLTLIRDAKPAHAG